MSQVRSDPLHLMTKLSKTRAVCSLWCLLELFFFVGIKLFIRRKGLWLVLGRHSRSRKIFRLTTIWKDLLGCFFAVQERPLGVKEKAIERQRGLDLLQVSQPLYQHLYQHPQRRSRSSIWEKGLDHHLDWKLQHIIISNAMYFQSLSNTKPSLFPMMKVERVDYPPGELILPYSIYFQRLLAINKCNPSKVFPYLSPSKCNPSALA